MRPCGMPNRSLVAGSVESHDKLRAISELEEEIASSNSNASRAFGIASPR
jgi:hypothetical protein